MVICADGYMRGWLYAWIDICAEGYIRGRTLARKDTCADVYLRGHPRADELILLRKNARIVMVNAWINSYSYNKVRARTVQIRVHANFIRACKKMCKVSCNRICMGLNYP